MKTKILCIALLCSVFFAGCKVSERVSSTKAYKQAVKEVQDEFASEGYRLSDTKRSSDIDGTKQDIYKFQDTVGNTMEYTVSYKVNNDDDVYYVENVQVGGCVTSNMDAYERMCGSDSPINKIEKLSKDEKISHVSAGKTIWWLVGFPLVVTAGLFVGIFGALAFI